MSTAENRLEEAEAQLSILRSGLAPLVKIANAYDANSLDDEARKFWGMEDQHQNLTPHDQLELYSGRGGTRLLTLADCMVARELSMNPAGQWASKRLQALLSLEGSTRELIKHYGPIDEHEERTWRQVIRDLDTLSALANVAGRRA